MNYNIFQVKKTYSNTKKENPVYEASLTFFLLRKKLVNSVTDVNNFCKLSDKFKHTLSFCVPKHTQTK